MGNNFLDLKFTTFNNLAHCHNVQANVRLSLKYLQKALDCVLTIPEIEVVNFQRGGYNLPMVETYLNTCNAYMFMN